jgi:hypothetical protein
MQPFFEKKPGWREHWKEMPEFKQDNKEPWKSITVHFNDEGDMKDFGEKINQTITENTKYVYHPKQNKENLLKKRYNGQGGPKYPVFVPTKGRWEKRHTIKMFERMGVPYFAVIEEQELEQYSEFISLDKIIVLPHKNKGLTVTRNWIWDFAQSQGVSYFWTFDDNIRDIYRLNRNMKYRMKSGIALQIIEQFAERFKNLYITGMQYEMFVPRKRKNPAFLMNTRIYSNMLIKTDIPYRNRTFYNDDTDLCLQILNDGHCTALIYAFLIDKEATMRQKGGMTDYYEKTDSRKEFVIELKEKWPRIVSLTRKYGRWHHHVNYAPFKHNTLKLKEGVVLQDKINEFGMYIENS